MTLSEIFALIAVTLFTGTAAYINLVEQPARMNLDDEALLKEWKMSYQRAFRLQASLALLGGLIGFLVYLRAFEWRWLFGALLILANWPYTWFVMMPINRTLMNTSIQEANQTSRVAIEYWGHLHQIRTLLGIFALIMFVWASRES